MLGKQLCVLFQVFQTATIMSKRQYQKISAVTWNNVHSVSVGQYPTNRQCRQTSIQFSNSSCHTAMLLKSRANSNETQQGLPHSYLTCHCHRGPWQKYFWRLTAPGPFTHYQFPSTHHRVVTSHPVHLLKPYCHHLFWWYILKHSSTCSPGLPGHFGQW